MMNIMILIKIIIMMTQDGTVSIYETPAWGLLDKKSIKVGKSNPTFKLNFEVFHMLENR